jgi:[ribosomal protein S5]-alanine N-acetyltransferase
MPGFPYLHEPLRDDLVAVRDYAERDIPEILIAYQDDPELPFWLGEERPPSGAELGRLFERQSAVRAAGVGVSLTILQQTSDVCAGGVNVHHVEWEAGHAEIGIWLVPQARNRGLARGALRLVGRWLLRDCGLERVHVMTQPQNEPMIRAARGAGFTREGVLRSYERQRGRRVDLVMLSLIASDL